VSRSGARALSIALFPLALGACVKKDYPPNRAVVEDLELLGTDSIDEDELEEGLATARTSKFLGLFEGVIYDYEVFDENVLARDLERIERYYRARGFYEARVNAARVIRVGPRHVRVEIRVREGDPVLTRNISIHGIERLPHPVAVAAYTAVSVRPDKRFDERDFEASRKAIENALADRGYAFAKVKHSANVDLVGHVADVEFDVVPGPPARYGEIRFVGLESIPEDPVRDTFYLERGEAYSRADLSEAQDALVNLGVFSNVEIREDRSKPESGEVPLTIVVHESSLRTIRLGGGARLDVLRFSTHLRAGWEHRNFLGGMRRFTIETKPGVTWFPTRIGRLEVPIKVLPENRLHTELRQPAFLEGRTTGFIAGNYNIYPLLYPIPEDVDPEDERVIGYHEIATSVGVERSFFSHHLFVSPSYNWQANVAFPYQGTLPDGLETLFVAFPELVTILDFRDNPIEPSRGAYFSNSFQAAGTYFGGQVTDFRVRPEARFYLPVIKRRVTLATRLTTGFLFPQDYGETLDPSNPFAAANPTHRSVIRDQHKLLFRAFYSGGPNSNRGYPYRGVGPHGPVGFLVPTGQDCSLDRPPPAPQEVADLPSTCIRPLGGLTLWEASAEFRVRLSQQFLVATFIDASDVTRKVGGIRFDVPHISVGPGLRYMTPVGPFRFDVGYRLPGLQQIGKDELPAEEGVPEDLNLFGLRLPVAIHLALGEAF
jgi:outer membrane protein assembly factor BamA